MNKSTSAKNLIYGRVGSCEKSKALIKDSKSNKNKTEKKRLLRITTKSKIFVRRKIQLITEFVIAELIIRPIVAQSKVKTRTSL